MQSKSSDLAGEKLKLTLVVLKIVRELLAILGMVINYPKRSERIQKTGLARSLRASTWKVGVRTG